MKRFEKYFVRFVMFKVLIVLIATVVAVTGTPAKVDESLDNNSDESANIESTSVARRHVVQRVHRQSTRTTADHTDALGTQETYAFALEQVLLSDGEGVSADGLRIDLGGGLVRTVVARDDALTHHRIELKELVFVLGHNVVEARRQQAQLTQPFFITTNSNGRVIALHFERTTKAFARGVLKSLVSSLQFVKPDGASERWQTEEGDPTGEYLAEYSTSESADVVTKVKRQYVRVTTANGLVDLEEGRVKVSDHNYLYKVKDSSVLSLEGAGAVHINLAEGVAPFVLRHKISVELLKRDRNDAAVGAFERMMNRLQTVDFATVEGLEELQKEEDVKTLAGASLEQLLAALVDGSRTGKDDLMSTVSQLEALFRLHPESIDRAVSAVLSGMDRKSESCVIGALHDADTAASQRGLMAIVNADDASQRTRMDALTSAALVSNPSPELTDSLGQLMDEDGPFGEAASLAYGATAKAVMEQNPDRASAMVNDLVERYENSTSYAEELNLLDAIGNTGSAEALPQLTSAFENGSPRMRGAAILSMRQINDPQSIEMIGAAMLSDTDARVRKDAIVAAGFGNTADYMSTLSSVLKSDDSAKVRLSAIRMLGKRNAKADGAIELLEWASAHDNSAQNRKMALALLENALNAGPAVDDNGQS